ncbi:LysM peptidoglycan-binding domain-containing protein [Gammaproteobacteria bacterium]|nr:LysM peptidoglycan-binding domain-containing protein [Gammaproteobacteria bacterium]
MLANLSDHSPEKADVRLPIIKKTTTLFFAASLLAACSSQRIAPSALPEGGADESIVAAEIESDERDGSRPLDVLDAAAPSSAPLIDHVTPKETVPPITRNILRANRDPQRGIDPATAAGAIPAGNSESEDVPAAKSELDAGSAPLARSEESHPGHAQTDKPTASASDQTSAKQSAESKPTASIATKPTDADDHGVTIVAKRETRPSSPPVIAAKPAQNVAIADPVDAVPLPQIQQAPRPEPPGSHSDVWQRIRAGYGIARQENPRIDHYVSYFAQRGTYLERIGERARRYMYYIASEVDSQGLPSEVALLPIIESALKPAARSHAQAVGLWQFIGATGRSFGLERNRWYDGRNDVRASTRAAAAYLKRLNRHYNGDWLLTFAAYNAGEKRVDREVRNNRRAGKPTDFFSLSGLPRETRNYVPRLLAVKRIVDGEHNTRLVLDPIPNRPYFELVRIDSAIDFNVISTLSGIDVEEIAALNPGFLRRVIPQSGPYSVLLPVGTGKRLLAGLEQTPVDKRLVWQAYQVKKGDTLSEIADRFDIGVKELRSFNGLRTNRLSINQELKLPRTKNMVGSIAANDGTRFHKVRNGDTLWDIARRYQVAVSDITRLNSLNRKRVIRPGQNLRVR